MNELRLTRVALPHPSAAQTDWESEISFRARAVQTETGNPKISTPACFNAACRTRCQLSECPSYKDACIQALLCRALLPVQCQVRPTDRSGRIFDKRPNRILRCVSRSGDLWRLAMRGREHERIAFRGKEVEGDDGALLPDDGVKLTSICSVRAPH